MVKSVHKDEDKKAKFSTVDVLGFCFIVFCWAKAVLFLGIYSVSKSHSNSELDNEEILCAAVVAALCSVGIVGSVTSAAQLSAIGVVGAALAFFLNLSNTITIVIRLVNGATPVANCQQLQYYTDNYTFCQATTVLSLVFVIFVNQNYMTGVGCAYFHWLNHYKKQLKEQQLNDHTIATYLAQQLPKYNTVTDDSPTDQVVIVQKV